MGNESCGDTIDNPKWQEKIADLWKPGDCHVVCGLESFVFSAVKALTKSTQSLMRPRYRSISVRCLSIMWDGCAGGSFLAITGGSESAYWWYCFDRRCNYDRAADPFR